MNYDLISTFRLVYSHHPDNYECYGKITKKVQKVRFLELYGFPKRLTKNLLKHFAPKQVII